MHGIKDESSGDEPKKAEVKVIYVSLDNIKNKEFNGYILIKFTVCNNNSFFIAR